MGEFIRFYSWGLSMKFHMAVYTLALVFFKAIFNALAGEERMIVSDVAGTTRDSVDVRFARDGQDYVFVDTAGVRRRTRITDIVEK